MQSPPPSVANKGTSAILAFLQLFLDAETSNQLWLGRLELTIVPPDISQLAKVSLFDATCNNISALPFDIGSWASLHSLQELRLSHNPLSSVPVSVSKLTQLRVLLLDHCDLQDVPAEFYVLSQLNSLNLDSNPKLSQPPPEILTQGLDTVRRLWNDLLQVLFSFDSPCCALVAVTYLQCRADGSALSLRDMRLRKIHAEKLLLRCGSVVRLDFSSNVLVEFPYKLNIASPFLQFLDLSHNRLDAIPDSIGLLTCLQHLLLPHNNILSLPETCGQLKLLQVFDVSHNPLQNLPGSLGFLRSLVKIEVEKCPLRMPPADVVAMGSVMILKFLKEVRLSVEANALDLSRLALEVLPASLCRHTDLTSLVLNDNLLASLPTAVAAMTKLHTMVLSRNKFQEIPLFISTFTNLRVLHLQNNSIKRFHDPFTTLVNLEELWADDNQISGITPSFGVFQKLKLFRAGQNRLFTIPDSLFECTALSVLRLDNNLLSHISSSVEMLSALRELSFTGCPIIYLPGQISKCPLLRRIGLESCSKLICPPPDVVERGFDTIKGFLYRLCEAQINHRFDCSWQSYSTLALPPDTIKSLTHLNLARNNFKAFPLPVMQLSSLTRLHIEYNKIQALPWQMGLLPVLSYIGCAGNPIDVPPVEVAVQGGEESARFLQRLALLAADVCHGAGALVPPTADEVWHSYGAIHATFDLSGLGLETIGPALFALPFVASATAMDLSSNRLVELSAGLGVMTSLKILDISDCYLLQSLPSTIQKCSALTEIRLQGCSSLTSLPLTLAYCTSLSSITYDHRSGLCIPEVSVLAKGGSAIRRYFEGANKAITHRTFVLSSCGLSFLPDALMNKQLLHIEINNNYVSSLPLSLFALEMLETLDVSFNRMLQLPAAIGDLAHLKLLNLDGNLLASLPDSIGYLLRLKLLSASSNRIVAMPETLPACTSLTCLRLNENILNSLPIGIGMLPHLVRIEISANPFSQLQLELALLTRLSALVVSDCPLLDPPVEVLNLGVEHVLQYLSRLFPTCQEDKRVYVEANKIGWGYRVDLSCLKLKTLTSVVAETTSITSLSLAMNNFPTFPVNLFLMTRLTFLNICDNSGISFLPAGLGYLTNITELQFDAHSITAPPPSALSSGTFALLQYLRSFDQARKGTVLDLTQGGYSSIPQEALNLHHLKSLVMRSNLLTAVPDSISALTSLVMLDVGQNRISKINPIVGSLTSLVDLRVDSNNLRMLPVALLQLSNLQRLDAQNNVMTSPPIVVCDKGVAAVMQFLVAVRDGASSRIMRLDKLGLSELPDAVLDCPTLHTLILNNNAFQTISSEIVFCPTLTTLDFSRNQIKTITSSIAELIGLTHLDLSDNLLTAVPLELHALTNLTNLCLSGNLALKIPPLELFSHLGFREATNLILAFLRTVSQCPTTHELSLVSCGLSSIALDLLPIAGLTSLNLSKNILRFLPSIITSLGTLQHIFASDNVIDIFPVGLPKLTSLATLNLSRNRLATISVDLGSCVSLKHIDFGGCLSITVLPESMGQLSALEVLKIASTKIHSLPNSFSSLCALQELDCSETNLSLIPPYVGSWVSLTKLRIVACPISILPWALGTLENITLIDVDRCPLEEPPQDVASSGGEAVLRYLRNIAAAASSGSLAMEHMNLAFVPLSVLKVSTLLVLSLSKNQLEEFPPEFFVVMTTLTHLNLSNNLISKVPRKVSCLSRLRILCLSDNEIAYLPLEIPMLMNLESLDVERNRVKNLPLAYLGLTSLTEFKITGNAWVSPPMEVMARGMHAVGRFLATLLHVGGINEDVDPWADHGGMLKVFCQSKSNPAKGRKHDSEDSDGAGAFKDSDDGATLNVDITPTGGDDTLWLDEIGSEIIVFDNDASAPSDSSSHDGSGLVHHSHDDAGNSDCIFPRRLLEGKGMASGVLDVSCLHLQSLAAVIDGVRGLQVLLAHDNLLSGLPNDKNTLAACKAIQFVKIARNQLDQIPILAVNSKSITHLDLRSNVLSVLPDAVVSGMPLIEILRLDSNQIAELPSTVRDWSRLRALSICYNNLAEIPVQTAAWTCLRVLRLSHNRLTSVTPACGKWKLVQVIDVAFNRLDVLPPELSGCSSITRLDASGNALKAFPIGVISSPTLKYLLLHSNLITSLPDTVITITSLKVLTVHNNQILSPPAAIVQQGLSYIKKYMDTLTQAAKKQDITLDSLSIEFIPDEIWLPKYSSITRLSMKYNRFQTLSPGTVSEDPELQHSNPASYAASQVALKGLSLSPMPHLTFLDVSSNSLAHLPHDLTMLSQLKILDVSYNNLVVLQPEFGRLLQLQKVNTRHNPWRSPPDPVIYMDAPRLTAYLRDVLSAAHSRAFSACSLNIVFFPPEICKYGELETLDLGNNIMSVIDPIVGNLTGLTHLSLQQNKICAVPWELGRLMRLRSLDISRNVLSELPPVLNAITSLKKLDCSNNQIITIPMGISSLLFLEELIAHHNPLTALPISLYKMVKLQFIDVSHCQLSALPGSLGRLSCLKRLNLCHNPHISIFPTPIVECPVLENVDLSHCTLISIDPAIIRMQLLSQLNIGSNRLTKLPPELGKCRALQALECDDNHLEDPPHAVIVKGTAMISEYLARLYDTRANGHLDLSDLSLEVLPVELFAMPVANSDDDSDAEAPLRVLTLTGNRLKALPLFVADLVHLEVLEVDDTLLEPPPAIRALGVPAIRHYLGMLQRATASRSLSLRGMQLCRMDLSQYPLDGILILSLESSDLRELPQGLEKLTCLTNLNLSNNKLRHIFDELCVMTRLVQLDLRKNVIASLPLRICDLSRLCGVHISDNMVTTITPLQWTGASCSEIAASSCRLQALPYIAGPLLRSVDVSNNNISGGLEWLARWNNVATLNLSCNNLSILGPDIRIVQALESLDVSSNKLTELPVEIGKCQALSVLLVSHNQLAELPAEIFKLVRLSRLAVDNNRIRVLSPNVGALSRLRELQLACNSLTTLPMEIGFLHKLELFSIHGNPSIILPVSSAAQGTKEMLEYFRMNANP
jgi:Leucine-rich repeat (LRR) protein